MLTILKAHSVNNPFSTQMEASAVPYLLVSSVSLTGLLLGLFWRHRGRPFFDEPGQAAFALHGILAACEIVATSISSGIRNFGNADDWNTWIHGPVLLAWLVVGIGVWLLYFRFASIFRNCGWWGKFFKALAIIAVLQIASMFIGSFLFVMAAGSSGIGPMLALQSGLPVAFGTVKVACLGIAVRGDFKARRIYHWTHWLGVATWLAYWAVTILNLVTVILFPPDLTLYP